MMDIYMYYMSLSICEKPKGFNLDLQLHYESKRLPKHEPFKRYHRKMMN